MGYTFKHDENGSVHVGFDKTTRFIDGKSAVDRFLVGGLKYSLSWDALMPVVEKIGNLVLKSSASYNAPMMFRIEIVNGYTKIEGAGQSIFYNSSVEGSMLNATYKAVIEFINWYNQQTTTNEQ